MTIQAQVSVQARSLVPRDYEVFAGLDVDKHSIAVTFCQYEGLLRSIRLPYRVVMRRHTCSLAQRNPSNP
jgi:hypothetical protein